MSAALRRITPLEISCVAAWLVLTSIDVTLLLAARPFVAHPLHTITLVLISVFSTYTLTLRALRPVHARLDVLSARQVRAVSEITDEIPRIASADAVRRLSELVEASDRDRDLVVAALQDAVARARAESATELQACMKWVMSKFAEHGIDPRP